MAEVTAQQRQRQWWEGSSRDEQIEDSEAADDESLNSPARDSSSALFDGAPAERIEHIRNWDLSTFCWKSRLNEGFSALTDKDKEETVPSTETDRPTEAYHLDFTDYLCSIELNNDGGYKASVKAEKIKTQRTDQ
ncbi:hypothetical protein GYMLUDRAFT_242756 [Collybiopsis luxurians FD-317 M1]|uniref:Uncharacterized protein n=1 Tax=Collybiopsis luxurians FD-317 M1 TaxID=944289 RepID=A0A0D0BFH7_9AGAR|nr:hypothetical protein GYMLUDRAFT_242756 [Collybiopsis luxurians FD-317 M1]